MKRRAVVITGLIWQLSVLSTLPIALWWAQDYSAIASSGFGVWARDVFGWPCFHEERALVATGIMRTAIMERTRPLALCANLAVWTALVMAAAYVLCRVRGVGRGLLTMSPRLRVADGLLLLTSVAIVSAWCRIDYHWHDSAADPIESEIMRAFNERPLTRLHRMPLTVSVPIFAGLVCLVYALLSLAVAAVKGGVQFHRRRTLIRARPHATGHAVRTQTKASQQGRR